MGDVNCWCNPAESAEDFGDFENYLNLMQQFKMKPLKSTKNNNINNKVPQSVIDVVNVSRQWESLLEKTENCHLCLALMRKMNSYFVY